MFYIIIIIIIILVVILSDTFKILFCVLEDVFVGNENTSHLACILTTIISCNGMYRLQEILRLFATCRQQHCRSWRGVWEFARDDDHEDDDGDGDGCNDKVVLLVMMANCRLLDFVGFCKTRV